MELSVVVKFNQIVTTTILIVALTTCVHFQEVQGLPIRVSRSALEPPLGEGSRDLDGGAEERVISKGNVRVGRDIGPGLVKENETAASVIYHANERESTVQTECFASCLQLRKTSSFDSVCST